MENQKNHTTIRLFFSLALTSAFVCGFTGCILKPIDPNQGFAVEAKDQAKFRHDVNDCEETATRMGFQEGLSVPEQSIRAGAIQRCLKEKGWSNTPAASAGAPVAPPSGLTSGPSSGPSSSPTPAK